MSIIRAFIIAFSMYSRIPMPMVKWDDRGMKYALCFFPFVGILTGFALWGAGWLCGLLGFGQVFSAIILTIIPLLINGGIHMDGFLDTVDALSSNGDRQEKLRILKDPSAGAFAVIFGIVYLLVNVGIWTELDGSSFIYLPIVYCLSRTLSAMSVISFPLAKSTGLAAAFSDAAGKRTVRAVLSVFIFIEALLLFIIKIKTGIFIVIAAAIAFSWHFYLCKRHFGGITGDIAGFFLQMAELFMLLAIRLAR